VDGGSKLWLTVIGCKERIAQEAKGSKNRGQRERLSVKGAV